MTRIVMYSCRGSPLRMLFRLTYVIIIVSLWLCISARMHLHVRKWTKDDVVSCILSHIDAWCIVRVMDAQHLALLIHNAQLELHCDAWSTSLGHILMLAQHWAILCHNAWCLMHSIEPYWWYTALNYTDTWCISLCCGYTASSHNYWCIMHSHINAWCTALS